MAKGDFVWFLGDDDLLTPKAIEKLTSCINKNLDCDFFWVNSFYLNNNYLKKYPYPFNTENLPKKMQSHSNIRKDLRINFLQLIDEKISFDFLLGIFVCVFKRKKWNENLNVIDKTLIKDPRVWSNFENTCFFIKIFCAAFKDSKTYVYSSPLSVSLHGVREWSSLYEFVEIVRIPEALDYYRTSGLSFFKYLRVKNYALRNFFNYFVKIIINGEKAGLRYVNFRRHFFMNLLYPNAWLSILYYIFRKLKIILKLNKINKV